MNTFAPFGFIIGVATMVLTFRSMRSAQIRFLTAYREKNGMDEPIDERELGMRYEAKPWRFLIEGPAWTWRRLRMLSGRLDDVELERLRREFQVRKALMYLSVPFAFVVTVLFSAIGH